MQRVPGPNGQDQNPVKDSDPHRATANGLGRKRELIHDIDHFILEVGNEP